MVYGQPAHNRTVTASPPYGGSGYTKPCSGFQPSARFCVATFGAGVIASQRPITCPKRQLQPERYATLNQIIIE
jgi:hypothetical protein